MDDDHFGHPQVNSPSCPPTIPKNNPLGTALPRPRSPGTQRHHRLPGPNHKGLSCIEERILEPQAPRSTERLNRGRPFQYHIRVSRSTERLLSVLQVKYHRIRHDYNFGNHLSTTFRYHGTRTNHIFSDTFQHLNHISRRTDQLHLRRPSGPMSQVSLN